MHRQPHTQTPKRTDLPGGDDVFEFGVLVDSQTQDVVRVLQVEALSSCEDTTDTFYLQGTK